MPPTTDHRNQPPKRRPRTPREKALLWLGGLLTAALVAALAFSFTGQSHRSGNGCIDWRYLTVIGSGESYYCGQTARALCIATIPKHQSDPEYYISLHRACRVAGLPAAADPVASGA